MPWPLASHFAAMVQHPEVAFRDPRLQSCTFETDQSGLPRSRAGAFAAVYKAIEPSGKPLAVRVFTTASRERRERYEAISEHLKTRRLHPFVDFEYRDNCIRSAGDGKWYPAVLMDWVEGPTLHAWLHDKCAADRRIPISSAAQQWLSVVEELGENKVAHGDLQHGNILVTEEGMLKLVDYDGMCVPDLVGRRNVEVGIPPYQHPERNQSTLLSLYLDRFSAIVIYVALRALAAEPRLWTTYVEQSAYDTILFRESDFRAKDDSPLYHDLMRSPDAEVPLLANRLFEAVLDRMEAVPPLGRLHEECAMGGILGQTQPPRPVAKKAVVERPPEPSACSLDAPSSLAVTGASDGYGLCAAVEESAVPFTDEEQAVDGTQASSPRADTPVETPCPPPDGAPLLTRDVAALSGVSLPVSVAAALGTLGIHSRQTKSHFPPRAPVGVNRSFIAACLAASVLIALPVAWIIMDWANRHEAESQQARQPASQRPAEAATATQPAVDGLARVAVDGLGTIHVHYGPPGGPPRVAVDAGQVPSRPPASARGSLVLRRERPPQPPGGSPATEMPTAGSAVSVPATARPLQTPMPEQVNAAATQTSASQDQDLILIGEPPARGLAEGTIKAAQGDMYYSANRVYQDPRATDEAVRRAEQAVAFRKSSDTYVGRGIAYCRRGHLQGTVSDFNEALRLNPRNAKAYHNRGVVQIMRGYPELAVADFTEAIRLVPGYAAAYANRAAAYSAVGRQAEAGADLTKARELGWNAE